MAKQVVQPAAEKRGPTMIAGRPLRWYFQGWRLCGAILVLLVLFPQFIGNSGAFTGLLFNADEQKVLLGINIGIFVILALGLNIVVGYAGLLDLGYVAFFALGAYFVGSLTQGFLLGSDGNPHTTPTFSWWVLLPLGAAVASFFGILLGAPTLRLRGDYLAIVTLGFGEIVPIVFKNVPWFGRQNGLAASGPSDIGPITFSNILDNIWLYYLTLALVVVAIFAVSALRDSSLGRAWVAIREDETAAASSGVNLVRTKLLAFSLGALFGGVGGALSAALNQNVNPDTLNFKLSIEILIMIVLGGIGSIPGVIVGASVIAYLDQSLLKQITETVHSSALVAPDGAPLHFLFGVDLATDKYLIFGLVMLIMILLRPQGLIPDVRRKRELKGIGASAEGASAIGLLEREEAEGSLSATPAEDVSAFAGPGSDAQGREG